MQLAFRPGNVDIDLNNLGNVNIDDVRFFGNYELENEFGAIENSAFPQMLLNAYDTPAVEAVQKVQLPKRVSRAHSTTSSQKWGDDSLDASNYDISFGFRGDLSASQQSPSRLSQPDKNILPGSGSQSGSRVGRVSDIEVRRGAHQRSISSMARSSLSISMDEGKRTAQRDSSLSMSMKFEEDIPAFEDLEAAGKTRYYDSLGGMDIMQEFLSGEPATKEEGLLAEQELPSFQRPEQDTFQPEVQEAQQAEPQSEEARARAEEESPVAQKIKKKSTEERTPKRRAVKRPNVAVIFPPCLSVLYGYSFIIHIDINRLMKELS